MEKLKGKKPNIRFPEFNDDWESKYGGDLFQAISNKNHNSNLPILAISQEFGAVPREMINYQISVTDKSIASYKVVEIGDFIISLRSFQGGIEFSNYNGICSPAYIILRPFIDLDRGFFKYYFKTFRYIQHLKSKLEGIRDGKMISYKYFSEIVLPTPSLPEQTRIASFFTLLDQKIAELRQKKTLLEQYKKGVMQKIFSQELRFKDDDGREFPKWEKKKLGEIAIVNPKNEALPDSFIYIDLESVLQGRLTKEDRINKSEAPSRAQRLLKKNDILFQMVRPYQKNNYFFERDENDYVASTGYAQIRKPDNSKFLFQFLHESSFVRKVIKLCTGTGYPAINATDLSNIDVNLPSDTEQTKIANFLSTIDEKITQTDTQIQQALAWKKGLLQNMFC